MFTLDFSWKFFTRRKNSDRINFSAFIPIVGTAVGTAIIILTLAIMDGIEEDIFHSLNSFSGTTIHFNQNSLEQHQKNVHEILDKHNITHSNFIDRKVILEHNEEFKIIQVRGIENIEKFIGRFDELEGEKPFSNENILIGKDLAYRINVYIGDTISMYSPLDSKIVTGTVPSKQYTVNTLYSTKLLDFDSNYAFVPFESVQKMFTRSGNKGIFTHTSFDPKIRDEILSLNKNIEIKQWNDLFKNLINAMKLEKIAYIAFGFLVILISVFSIISVMSYTILQKSSHIGILKTIGYENNQLKTMFSKFGLISGVIGSLIGLFLAHIFIGLEESYSLIYQLFGSNPYLIFPLKKSVISNCVVPVITSILITFAAYIPALNLIKIDPVKTIGMSH